MIKNKICVNDFLAVAAVVLLALAIFLIPMLSNRTAEYIKITSDKGEQIISLSEDSEYEIISNNHSIVVKIENREVSVMQATCPDKVCVNSGMISRGGEVIVCAPALVSIEIIGFDGEVDYAVG